MKEYVAWANKKVRETGRQLGKRLGWKLSAGLVLATLSSACSPIFEQQSSSIQSATIIYPNPSRENLGLNQSELNQLRSIKQDFINQAEEGNILGFALDESSSKNERLTPQEIIANNLSKASGVNILSDQIDAPNELVMPMMISIGKKDLPMISQIYEVMIEGEEKSTKLLYFYTKEEGAWRQTGFITEQPTYVDEKVNYKYKSQQVISEEGDFLTFGMVIASDSDPKNNNLITITNIDGLPVIVETFSDGSQIMGFLPRDNDFFFPPQTDPIASDELMSFKISSAVTQTPPVIGDIPTAFPETTPVPKKTAVEIPATATATRIATATATPTPTALNVAPEVQAVLDAQSAPYTVNAEGKAVIDLKDTTKTEKIVLETIGHTPTNDGLAKDILAGLDKEGARYAYAEGYGWVKDIDFSQATIENPLEIPWELASHQEALNAIFALQYAEKPTISPDAVIPNYFIQTFGADNTYITSQAGNRAYNNPDHKPATKFTKSTQYFTEPKVLATTDPKGQEFIILSNTNLNPTEENKDQTINLFKWMGEKRYDALMNTFDSHGTPRLITFLIGNVTEASFVLVPPAEIGGIKIPWDPNTWQDNGKRTDPAAAAMQKRGELTSLLSEQEREVMEAVLVDLYGGPVYGDGHAYEVAIDHIPEEIALYHLLANFETWTYPPGKE